MSVPHGEHTDVTVLCKGFTCDQNKWQLLVQMFEANVKLLKKTSSHLKLAAETTETTWTQIQTKQIITANIYLQLGEKKKKKFQS